VTLPSMGGLLLPGRNTPALLPSTSGLSPATCLYQHPSRVPPYQRHFLSPPPAAAAAAAPAAGSGARRRRAEELGRRERMVTGIACGKAGKRLVERAAAPLIASSPCFP